MGTFKINISKLLLLFLVSVCFLLILSDTGYQVLAENDPDLVFESNLEDTNLNSKHSIDRIGSFHHRTLKTDSSQPSEEDEHWLSSAAKRVKRQFSDWFNFGLGETTTEQPTTVPPTIGQQQGQGQEEDDDLDNDSDFDDEDDDIDDLVAIGHGTSLDESDDEDEFESGEGSARIPFEHIPIIPGTPVYYRITLSVQEPFVPEFNDNNSPQYKKLASDLSTSVDTLYNSLEGRQSATVIKIQKREADLFSSKATLDLGTIDFYDHSKIRNHLYSHIIKYHRLGELPVTTDDFTFRQFEVSTPLPECQTNELPCQNGQCVPSTARCNGVNECSNGSDEMGCGYDDIHINEVNLTPTISPLAPNESSQPVTDTGLNIDQVHTQGSIDDRMNNNNNVNFPISTTPVTGVVAPHDNFTPSTPYYLPPLPTNPPQQPETRPPSSNCRGDNSVPCNDGKTTICDDQQCDGTVDCPGGEDEKNCSFACAQGEVSCDISRCIPVSKRCDGLYDCQDRTDELECEPQSSCRSDQFKCDDGYCLEGYQRCNQVRDCRGGEDETNCPGGVEACGANEVQCGDKTCIPIDYRCDGFEDCNDGADEAGCSSIPCGPRELDCGNNNCIPESQKCDGRQDCPNGIDELNCNQPPPRQCGAHEHTCNDGSCIPSYLVCDGTSNCNDGSDESECGCGQDEFQCGNGACIPNYLHCDRRRDCQDGSDEINCSTEPPVTEPEPPTLPPTINPPISVPCSWGQQPCKSGNQCFPYAAFCDGRFDCNDLSDESDCPGSSRGLQIKTYPSQQTIKESREVVFQCRDEGPLRAKVQWVRGNGLPLPSGSRDLNGRLEIPNIQIEHGGSYTCAAIGYPPSTPGSQVNVYLTVEPYNPPPTRPPTACNLHEATCANGDCIAKELVCNGNYDCSDGSDETRCSDHQCEPNEFRCDNKQCVLKTWRCDGDSDCSDGSDEANCATNPPGSACQYNEFACHSGNQCIPKSYHCDHQSDCIDGSDEVGCSNVVIAKPPPPMVQLSVGQVFIISCTAVGVPTPEVVWRLNWGHIPSKCSSTSVNGVGTLTCPNIQIEDQGAYSCEAINIRGSIFAIPDTILVVDGAPSVCPRGTFNKEAHTSNECISCFCFGSTTECRSADLFTYQLQPPFDSHKYVGVQQNQYSGVSKINTDDIYRGAQPEITPLGSNGVRALLASPYAQPSIPNVTPYFAMPENYQGNQLKSYGGYLKYSLHYEGFGRPIVAPDVIMIGNGYTLLHTGEPHNPGRDEQISVRLFTGEWLMRSETAPEKLATREEIMMVLENVENLLIKLQYTESHLDTSIRNIEMDSAAVRNTGLGQAIYVEECTCPVGYSGLSCENCASGYARHRSGPWLGQCYKEPDVCPPGTYGDPSRGIRCQPCSCPLTTPSNQFGNTCELGPDGGITCNCPPGYTGRRCEQCAVGYTGNPLIPGDSCQPGGSRCNSEGTQSEDASGRCNCKQNTDGFLCDQCKPNTFHLSRENQFGCIACFCMGITQQCTSSNWYRDSISSAFTNSINQFQLVESLRKDTPISQGIRLDQNTREIVYSEFSNQNQDVYYWALPSRYLGDKVATYGGNLQYSLRYVPMPGGQSSRNTAPDVELISDNHINLLYFGRDYPQPNSNQTITVPLLEQHWQRADGQKADREHLLMALADLKAVLIKATYTTNTREAALISVSLDIASERNNGRERALSVEQCQCPPGYRGLSCEDCDSGYTRASEGLYLGLCELCSCNGHSSECDPDDGNCLNCRDHTAGPNCEQCEPGYILDPITGQCRLNDNERCECNPHGAISPFCVDNRCQCKVNVEGDRCNRCRVGTFGLNSTNPDGCQECFCSGVTDQCGESNLYIEQIPSQLLDPNNHGFTLTDSNQRERINSDFIINVAENKIGFQFRQGPSERWYWSLPTDFVGNKIKSYGGKLEFTQEYSAFRPDHAPDQDVIIIGNGITIFWTNPLPLQPDRNNKVSVQLSPNSNWQRLDHRQGPRPASREDILVALANINAILVRATLATNTVSSYISDISLDTAVEQYTGQPKAIEVESCRCPQGYRGGSCEACSAGYYRDLYDLQTGPLGSCSKCPCSGNEESCVLGYDNRVACNCLPGYKGTACEIIDSVTTDSPVTTLPPDPVPGPTIIVTIDPPLIKIVEVGTSLRLRCSATSGLSNINPIRLTWSKDGGYLPEDHITDDGRGLLVITDIRISDSGTYICQATDGYTIVTEQTTITVGSGNEPQAPTVNVSPPSIQVVEGETIEIQYYVTGNPTPNVQWIRLTGEPLNPQLIFGNGIFRIRNALISDSGEYEIIVTNTAGIQRQRITIRVLQSNEPIMHPIITPSRVYGKLGDTFILVCEAPGPLRSIVWSRPNRQPLPYSSHQNADNSLLTVYDAKLEDSGIYVCTATSYSGTSGSTNVTVSISTLHTETFPTVVTRPKTQTVSQGSTIEIHCEATGVPSPTIKWTRIGEAFAPHIQQVGPVLKLQNVQVRDRGVYICVASNSAGVAQDSSIVEIEQVEAPVIEIQPSTALTVISGGSLIMQCRTIAGIPQPEVSWTRADGSPLSISIEQLSSGVLRFTKVSLREAGEYICTASNKAGKTTAIGHVEVHTVPVLTISPRSGIIDVNVGDYIRLECQGSGTPQPTVQWSKHSSGNYPNTIPASLPGGVDQIRRLQNVAVYEITHVTIADQGYYICQGTNDAGAAEERVSLIVNTVPERGDITERPGRRGEDGSAGQTEVIPTPYPPYITPKPRDNEHQPAHTDKTFTAPVGTRAELRCQTNANAPSDLLYVNWVRGDNSSLPANSVLNNGILYIDNVQPLDAGEYQCLGIHKTGAIIFSFSAHLVVVSPPRITLEPSRQIVRPGDNAFVLCDATGEQPITITWSAINRPMPQSAIHQDGKLQFRGIQVTDAGRYRCTAVNSAGEADAVADVVVQDPEVAQFDFTTVASVIPAAPQEPHESSELDIQPSSPNCYIGDTVDLYCRSNEPGVIVTWSKVSDRLADNIQTSGGTLRFNSAVTENSGVYRCEARGQHSTYYKEYTFEVLDPNFDNIQGEQPIETKTAPQGSTVIMECRSDLGQPISYKWSKPGGALPRGVDVFSRTIEIQEVKQSDAGTYICTASNGQNSIDVPTILLVTGIVPYFVQAPTSFVALPTLPDAYIQFNFEISFRPEVSNGLFLYNGHRKSAAKGDFISLALVKGVPEFRFNLGQDVTVVSGDAPVELGKWHTIKIVRNRKKVSMYVDTHGPFVNMSDGKLLGLDLTENLYLGGVPNFKEISPDVQVNSGFVGCISRLKIGHTHLDILNEAIMKEGITTCETCTENPCHNQGVCQEALSKEGYTCICSVGFSGPTCSKQGGESCTPNSCGVGRCIDTDDSFKCLCPLGRGGNFCEKEVLINEPAFSNGAFLAYPTPKPQRRLKVSLKFKPRDLSDGILLYCSENEEGNGNFVSLAIKDGHVEFRFDIGNDPVVVKSDKGIQSGEWLAVTASKFLNEGRLLVNGDAPIVKQVSKSHKPLNLHTPLYVGGVDKDRVSVNHGVGVANGFNGCISEISISGVDLHIVQSATDSANIEDCNSIHGNDLNESSNEILPSLENSFNKHETGCSSNPCRNDGQCYPISSTHYKCNCVNGYKGSVCEISPELCSHLQPCQNGGTCNGTTSTYNCDCPIGFTGTNCEQRADIRNEVHFKGNSYIELNSNLLSHQDNKESEVIAFELSTNSSKGLIFWHGQKPNEEGQGQDYLALAVVDGYLEYSFELGSGPAIIYNNQVRISDGQRHRVILKRQGRWGSIEVDNDYTSEGFSDGKADQINTHGNIYLGGTPNNSLMTGDRYQSGFNGCIHGFELQDSRMIDLGVKALYGVNVKSCSSSNDTIKYASNEGNMI